ncbi:MAG: 6-carboxytetrahydropterin synthase QueD [bacterium]
MYKICVKGNFSAAHFLRNYKGKCEKIHGHNWAVEVLVGSAKLREEMVMDFKDLKKTMGKTVSLLDHNFLNRIKYFKKVNPTSENIAKFIFTNIKKLLPKSVELLEVTVEETPSSKAVYTGG